MSRYELDPATRMVDGATVVVGGSPLRLLRLSTRGAEGMQHLAITGEIPGGAAHLVDRLLEAGMVHPIPEPGSGCAPRDVTVVIPAFETASTVLEALVRSAYTEGVHAVIVVDDASAVPLTVDADATMLRLSTNVGPGGARNHGAALATTPVIAFLDTDTVPEPGWLEPLLGHVTDPRVGLVAPRVVATGTDAGWLNRFERWRSPLDLGALPARIRAGSRVSYVPAAALVVRAEALRAVGGFDETLRLGEDVDLVWRLDAAGWRCRYEPASRVAHRTRPTLGAWLRQRYAYGTSAAPLADRHGRAVAPVRMSGWSALAWAVGSSVSSAAGIGIGLGTIAALARRLPPMDHPWREAGRLAGLGNLYAGRSLAAAITRTWWPFAVIAALVSRRARRLVALAVLVPAAVDLVQDRPPIDPARAVVLRLAEDVAYGAGAWAGMSSSRSFLALRPDFVGGRTEGVRRPRRSGALRAAREL